jgi:hypothetical protein
MFKPRKILMPALVVVMAAGPALAGGKKEGAGESGGGAVAPIESTIAGPKELTVPSAQASQSLGTVTLSATMLAGAGAGKCRMNFVIYNGSSATIAFGAIGSAFNAKGDVVDNWVVNIGSLAPASQTARLFSCGLGGAQLGLAPLPDFSWPPVKCVTNPDQDPEPCAVDLRIKSTLPLAPKK